MIGQSQAMIAQAATHNSIWIESMNTMKSRLSNHLVLSNSSKLSQFSQKMLLTTTHLEKASICNLPKRRNRTVASMKLAQ